MDTRVGFEEVGITYLVGKKRMIENWAGLVTMPSRGLCTSYVATALFIEI